MNSLWNALWLDESGMILSAEATLLGTVGIVGATVGLSAASRAVDDELKEFALAVRSLDQSFAFEGQRSEFAWTAGSSYTQPPVKESQRQLREEIRKQEEHAWKEQKAREEKNARDPQSEEELRQPDHPPRRRHFKGKKRSSTERVDPNWELDGTTSASFNGPSS